jgi:hypothetical protein
MIYTYTHKTVDVLNMQPENVCIEDIAHSLALINRFVGHTPFPINVAHHSIWVAKLCNHLDPVYQLQALLHDAAEAYLGDISKWLKATPTFDLYREAEDRASSVILTKFGCPIELHHDVEAADRKMVTIEAFTAFGDSMPLFQRPDWSKPTSAELASWSPMGWRESEEWFLMFFHSLIPSIAVAPGV